MIKLKSATIRELRKEAEQRFKNSWQPELQIEAFMDGVEMLLNSLRLSSQTHINRFFEWRGEQKKVKRGGNYVYDIKGHHIWLTESELFDYWLEHINCE